MSWSTADSSKCEWREELSLRICEDILACIFPKPVGLVSAVDWKWNIVAQESQNTLQNHCIMSNFLKRNLANLKCSIFYEEIKEHTILTIMWFWTIYIHVHSSPLKKQILNVENSVTINSHGGASLVAQWLRIHLPMQGTRVRAQIHEDPTCCGATKPVCHNYWACALEPANHNYWACKPQLLKPVCLEPVLHNKRSHRNEKPAHRSKE